MSVHPNLVYFHCHDLGRFLGTYGRGETPALDRFAENAIVFDRAFCASPPCSPSRASALTGKVAHRNGCLGLAHRGWPLPLSETTLVDDLSAAGYQTVLCGVNHERHPRTDRYQWDINENWDDWRAQQAVDHAIGFLKKRDRSSPFFLNVGTQEPHRSTWHHFREKASDEPQPTDPGWLRYPGRWDEFILFSAARREMDAAFGRLMDAIQSEGLEDDTIIVFTTDHGVFGSRAKGTLYTMGTEIALMIRYPGATSVRRGDLISNVDFRATFLDLLGLEVPSDLDGRSFASVCRDGEVAERLNPVFCEYNFHGKKSKFETDDSLKPLRSIRNDRYHLIGDFTPGMGSSDLRATWELYDTFTDPGETRNLSGFPELSGVETALREELYRWIERTEDFLATGEFPVSREPPGWGERWVV